MIDLIRREFDDDPTQLLALDQALATAGEKRYQAAFVFLQGRRGQQTANEIVRNAVWAARLPEFAPFDAHLRDPASTDEDCSALDLDNSGWALNPGNESLGKLLAAYPARFGRSILTTNFDPLIEVAIRRAGGLHFRTILHTDGNLLQTVGDGCHVIHLHGYWYGSDTLHTTRQLGQSRPRLKASLSALLRNKVVVACAYSGWDDTFTEAMMDVVRDDTAYPEIIWAFYSDRPNVGELLSQRLSPGIDRGRVTLYAGIDCHDFFPKLYSRWTSLDPEVPLPRVIQSNPVRVSGPLEEQLQTRVTEKTVIEGDDEDRPPVVEICVGREEELQKVKHSTAKVVFLTGLGGQGKSTLAARYFADCQSEKLGFLFYVWRDCKEESERFENQLASVIEKLSGGKASGEDLAKQDAKVIVEILLTLIRDLAVLFVFDNVDHYVNLETERMTGSPDILIDGLLQSDSPSRAVFTCRPSVSYGHPRALSCHLEGIGLEPTVRLFSERGASSKVRDIEDAHQLTEGHAFWLDLLAIQVAKPASGVELARLVSDIRSGGGPLPTKTLNSIWTTLKDREQTVLRAMAETVRPETEAEIGEYLRHELNYNRVIKALRALRALNLVVVKRRPEMPDFLELHPMVRQFIRQNFKPQERRSFIDAIINVYKQFIGSHRTQLKERPPLSVLQYWTQNAELDITAGRIDDAFFTLAEVCDAFLSSAYSREFCRVVRLLLSSVDWVAQHSSFKAFEIVFKVHVRILSYLGEYSEVDNLLDKYEMIVPDKDARYINYCDMRCYSNWIRGEFTAAVKWGRIGQKLKESSGVDTKYDVTHSLALAERDAGQPEFALSVFLGGRSLSEVVDPEELDEKRDGAHYGNIGRCLHFMGQVDNALICYQKSALLIEKGLQSEHVLNQGYIRLWVGELLAAREQFKLSLVFFRAAYLKWEQTSPPKASKVALLSKQISARAPNSPRIDDRDVEGICVQWILGRSVDAQYR